MEFRKIAWVSLGVAIISWLLSWIYSRFFPQGILNFGLSFSTLPVNVQANVGSQIVSGIDPTLAGRLLGTLNGSLPMGIGAFATLFIAAFAVVWLGTWLNSMFGLGKSENMKFAISLTLGSTVVGLIVGAMSRTPVGQTLAIGTAVTLLIYYLIVVAIYNLARQTEMGRDVLPIP